MREIKFRAKRLDNGEWVTGYFTKNPQSGNCYITTYSSVGGAHPWPVEPETVGEYAGMNDKRGREIYEGDIVSFSEYPGENYYAEIFKISSPPHNFAYAYTKKPNSKVSGISNGIGYTLEGLEELGKVEVIGNIYENPDLLGGDKHE